jgi:hypothetical protein
MVYKVQIHSERVERGAGRKKRKGRYRYLDLTRGKMTQSANAEILCRYGFSIWYACWSLVLVVWQEEGW